jgi:hypothetical protein
MDSPPPHDNPPSIIDGIPSSIFVSHSFSRQNSVPKIRKPSVSKDTKTFCIQKIKNLLDAEDTKTFCIQKIHPPSAISHNTQRYGYGIVMATSRWLDYRRALRSHHNDNPSNLFQPNHDHATYPS